ncbi:CPBP family intramembrane glutamic endopeptidase [Kribbella sp. NPDC051952]|uniref:CPBP family intramembrane glutamic endopeptidase n=1 Tax=Kribbella sp. NPDC051952 TaxID=3154851 RepID=UPI0034287592
MSAEHVASQTARDPLDPRAIRHDLIHFGVVTLALSWIPWIVLAAVHADIDSGPGALVFAAAAAGPSLAALGMRGHGRRCPEEFKARWNVRWPVAALLFAGAPALIVAVLAHLGDLNVIPEHASSTIASAGGPLGALAYTLISGPLSEEFGWRGFVQPRLRRTLRVLPTTLVIGSAWVVWHVPLFFVPGTGQHDDGIGSLSGVLFFVGLFPLSYTMLFVSERLRGGVWAAILAHASYNLSEALVPDPNTVATAAKTAVTFLVAALCWILSNGPERSPKRT